MRRALTAALTLAAVCAVAGCATTGGAAAPPNTAAPTAEVAGPALETLLLDDADIARITAAPALHTVETYAQVPDPDGRTYSDALCGGAIFLGLHHHLPRPGSHRRARASTPRRRRRHRRIIVDAVGRPG